MRLRSAPFLPGVLRTLEELGFAGEVLRDVPGDEVRWYGPNTVRELSREEAGIIAQRVVLAFAAEPDLNANERDALAQLVAEALYTCFVAHTADANAPAGALRDACARAVEQAARGTLGPARAAALGRAVAADLASAVDWRARER